jgi:hypothetical protein
MRQSGTAIALAGSVYTFSNQTPVCGSGAMDAPVADQPNTTKDEDDRRETLSFAL